MHPFISTIQYQAQSDEEDRHDYVTSLCFELERACRRFDKSINQKRAEANNSERRQGHVSQTKT
jgi:hypothetical protein